MERREDQPQLQQQLEQLQRDSRAAQLPQPGDFFRVGTKVPRNLYWVRGPKLTWVREGSNPASMDVGRIDFPNLAAWIVDAANNKIRGMVGAGEAYLNEVEAERDQLRAELVEVTADRDQRQRLLDASQARLAEQNRVEGSRVRKLRAKLEQLRAEQAAHEGELGDMRAQLSAAEAETDRLRAKLTIVLRVAHEGTEGST